MNEDGELTAEAKKFGHRSPYSSDNLHIQEVNTAFVCFGYGQEGIFHKDISESVLFVFYLKLNASTKEVPRKYDDNFVYSSPPETASPFHSNLLSDAFV
ncbi:unnamed protein product [Angiostrongylus costaricensis]|uniref:SCP domain-containing protein n=1 Tax=Angiostrongylus costaricensis TaxID=334426 RepID=A0A0R3PAP8_ANGCS|nr:unnamed protein product [Angiostrongylus costaricensis]